MSQVAIVTHDIERLMSFYERVLGFKPYRKGNYANTPKLDKIANGPRPFDHGKDNPKVLKAINDEWGKQIMKSKEARSYLTEEELNAFYGSIKDPEKWAKPMGESLTKTNGRVMMERLKKSLRDPLNGKTSI